MVIEVLKRLEVPHEHIFSCDIDPHCRALIQHCHRPQNLFVDIRKRPINAVPDIDLYVFAPPCTAFSSAGLRGGLDDPTGQLLLESLRVVHHRRPRVCICENVPNVAGAHKGFLLLLESALHGAGYSWRWQVLSTNHYGIPQRRRRFYLVAVRLDSLQGEIQFPRPLATAGQPLMRLVPRSPHWQALPPRQGKARRLVQWAYEAMAAKNDGANPFVQPVCLDAGVTQSWCSAAQEMAPTLTRTSCARFSYWLSTKGDFLDEGDFAVLQGVHRQTFDWAGAGLTCHQFAGIMGNSMSANVLEFLLPLALQAAGILTMREVNVLQEDSARRLAGA